MLQTGSYKAFNYLPYLLSFLTLEGRETANRWVKTASMKKGSGADGK